MKTSLRGALWSALVFPGSGQIVLGNRKRGVLFAAFAVCCAAILVTMVAAGTWNGLENLAGRGEAIDLHSLLSSAFSGVMNAGTSVLPLLFLCWAGSVFDAWRMGMKIDDQMLNSHTSDHGV